MSNSAIPETVKNTARDQDKVLPLDFDQRYSLIDLSLKLGEQSADRLWSRFSHILTVNGALAAFVTFSITQQVYTFSIVVGALGAGLAIIWERIHRLSQFYEERYRRDASYLIDEDPTMRHYLRARSKEGPRVPRPSTKSVTDYARAIIYLIFIFWIIVILFCLLAYFGLIGMSDAKD